MVNKYNDFYDSQDRENIYSSGTSTEMHGFTDVLEGIKTTLQVDHPKVLEIGAGNGRFQNIFDNYTGIDITENTRKFFHKNYIVIKDKERYPFKNEEFDLIFTNAVFEHIPDIDTALKEMIRVTKYGGVIVFNPAWQCRPWAANGYQVRPYSDFNFSGKLYKLIIPIRENIYFRLSYIMPKRFYYLAIFLINPSKFYKKLFYKKIEANYEKFWQSDSDACNSIDPFLVILYFKSNGLKIENYPSLLKQFLVRTNELILRKS